MVTAGKIARRVAAAGAALVLVACTSGGSDPAPGETGLIDAFLMRAALLQPEDIGPTWVRPERTEQPAGLVSLCGGGSAAPQVPGSPVLATASLVDEGDQGAQAFDQYAMTYADAAAAESALDSLRSVADGCPPTVSQSAQPQGDGTEAGYTESAAAQALTSGSWYGFVVLRHKQYAATSPGTADTAVAVLHSRNVVLVAGYSIYWLGNRSADGQFTNDWKNLVGTVLQRVK